MTAALFTPATRRTAKARIALLGPTGSGKTYTALAVATGLADGAPIAGIDTEKGSMSLYADEFRFDVLELNPPFRPSRYVEAIEAAEAAGYAVVVIDSMSHAWFDEGGVLDMVDEAAVRYKGNKFAAWREGTPEQNRLVNAIVRSDLHVIATMRSKTEWVLEDDGKGGKAPRKIGMAPVQRDQVEYEFTIVGELDQDHRLHVTKSRMRSLADEVLRRPDAELGVRIREWLVSGTPEPVAPSARSAEGDAALAVVRRAWAEVGADTMLAYARLVCDGLGEPSPATASQVGNISDAALIALADRLGTSGADMPGTGEQDDSAPLAASEGEGE